MGLTLWQINTEKQLTVLIGTNGPCSIAMSAMFVAGSLILLPWILSRRPGRRKIAMLPPEQHSHGCVESCHQVPWKCWCWWWICFHVTGDDYWFFIRSFLCVYFLENDLLKGFWLKLKVLEELRTLIIQLKKEPGGSKCLTQLSCEERSRCDRFLVCVVKSFPHIQSQSKPWGKGQKTSQEPHGFDLVDDLEHVLFFHILGRILPTDELHHFSGGYVYHQLVIVAPPRPALWSHRL